MSEDRTFREKVLALAEEHPDLSKHLLAVLVSREQPEAFEAALSELMKSPSPLLVEKDGTSSAAGKLLSVIAQHEPAGYAVERDEVESLIQEGFVSYGLHPLGGYRASMTPEGFEALSRM